MFLIVFLKILNKYLDGDLFLMFEYFCLDNFICFDRYFKVVEEMLGI